MPPPTKFISRGLGDKVSVDIYVLANARSRAYVERFQTEWLQDAVPARERYEFPMDAAEPEITYDAAAPLIDRLLQDHQQPYSIYWNDYEGDVLNPMLFFTNDGGMIVGLTVREDGANFPEFYLDALTKSVDGRGGVITWETPPPLNQGEYMEWAKQHRT